MEQQRPVGPVYRCNLRPATACGRKTYGRSQGRRKAGPPPAGKLPLTLGNAGGVGLHRRHSCFEWTVENSWQKLRPTARSAIEDQLVGQSLQLSLDVPLSVARTLTTTCLTAPNSIRRGWLVTRLSSTTVFGLFPLDRHEDQCAGKHVGHDQLPAFGVVVKIGRGLQTFDQYFGFAGLAIDLPDFALIPA
jgi:hypothetical protein